MSKPKFRTTERLGYVVVIQLNLYKGECNVKIDVIK